MNIIYALFTKENFTPDQLKFMFEMYVQSYSNAGNELWFKNPEELLRYDCAAMICDASGKIITYILIQRRRNINKLSLCCHDGTYNGKQMLVQLIKLLLNQPGNVLEAAGAVSWLLRRETTDTITLPEIISDPLLIADILDLNTKPTEFIRINKDFDIKDKHSHHYEHYFTKNGVVEHVNKETLFGKICESKQFTSDDCDRRCIYVDLAKTPT